MVKIEWWDRDSSRRRGDGRAREPTRRSCLGAFPAKSVGARVQEWQGTEGQIDPRGWQATPHS